MPTLDRETVRDDQVARDVSRNAAAIRGYLVRHDVACLAPGVTFVDVTSGMQWTGAQEINGMLAWFYEVAFDAHLEDERLIVGDSGAVLEATFVGRHCGEFAGVAPTDRVVRVPLVIVYDIADGLIQGARIHFSVASFLAQTAA